MSKKNLQIFSNAITLLVIAILLLNINYSYLNWKDYATIIGSGFIIVVLVITSLRKKR